MTVGAWYKILSLHDIAICDFTSWGSHKRLLESTIINIQVLGDRTNPSVLWLKYDFNIEKTASSQLNFTFCTFSMSKMITAHFSTVE